MKTIPLTQGKVALVDDADVEWLSKWKWYASREGKGFYAVRSIRGEDGKMHRLKMHRLLIDVPKGFETDHINGDGLDNRRSNLRVATRSQNVANRGARCDSSSGVKGVGWLKRNRKWQANIGVNGCVIYLGSFSRIADAAKAHAKAARCYHGEFARVEAFGAAGREATAPTVVVRLEADG